VVSGPVVKVRVSCVQPAAFAQVEVDTPVPVAARVT
jgi:hypothetical protein